ncbi:MAG: PAS domain S-box protein [Ignavibacteria bacterium]
MVNQNIQNLQDQIRILNQLIAAQNLSRIFPNTQKVAEFLKQILQTIPGIETCSICLPGQKHIIGGFIASAEIIRQTLATLPENQEQFSIEIPTEQNVIVFPLKTLNRQFGYVCLLINSYDSFDLFRPAINNFLNVIALDLENKWQNIRMKIYQDHLEELVEQRTKELQEKVNECILAEESIRISEEKFREIYNSSPIAIELYSHKGELLDVNKSCLELFGISNVSAVKGFNLFNDPNLNEQLKQELLNGQSVRREIKFDFELVKKLNLYDTTRNGFHYLEIFITPYNTNGNKQNIAYLAHIHDISERKYEEKEHAATIELLKIINTSKKKQDLIEDITAFLKQWLNCDAIGIRLRENDDFPYYVTIGFPPKFVKAERYLCSYDSSGNVELDKEGLPLLECMCGNILYQRVDSSKPFFTNHGSFWSNNTTELLSTTTEEDRLARTRNRCNSNGYKSVGLFPIRFANETFGLLQVNDNRTGFFSPRLINFLEMTANKIALSLLHKRTEESLFESEERFRSFVENANDIVYSMNLDGIFTYVSPKWKEILGHDLDEILGQSYSNFILADDLPEYQSFIGRTIKTGEKQEAIECRVRHKEGIFRWLSINASPLKSDETILTLMGIARDITPNKNAQLQLEKYSEELKALNVSKDKLFSILAHDLRGPFSGFMGITEELAKNIDKLKRDEISEFASVMHSTALKIFGLLTNLLEWSRLQTDRIAFNPAPVDIYYETVNVCFLFSSAAMAKSIRLTNSVKQDTIVYADEKMLSTVLRNIISNAIKFTHNEGKISINATESDGFIQIEISDSGVGMSEKNLSDVFKIDSVITTKGTNNEEGSGLGLVLCREMVKKNGGNISVTSEPGKGTSFTFTLPKVPGQNSLQN